jgi:hypothetical protein
MVLAYPLPLLVLLNVKTYDPMVAEEFGHINRIIILLLIANQPLATTMFPYTYQPALSTLTKVSQPDTILLQVRE